MSLTLILGPMYSGKSTKLLEYHRKYKLKHKCLLINHSSDKRYTNEEKICTHDLTSENCIFLDNIEKIEYLENFDDYEIIFIDEGQFFQDLVLINRIVNEYNKTVFISGLKADFKNNGFKNILDLIPLCDDLIMLKSICSICKKLNDGIYSKKIEEDNKIIDVGSVDKYIPVCRKHFNN